jgi:predicted metal-dependent peptidase
MAKVVDTDERLKNLIARFVLNSNYWGYLFSMIRRKANPDAEHTMGVASESEGTLALYYKPEHIDSMSDGDILKVLEHEGMHILNKHIPRLIRILAEERDPLTKMSKMEIFNYAADAAANEQANLREPIMIMGKSSPFVLPEETLKLPPKKTTEFYFLELLKKAKKISVTLIGGHDQWAAGGIKGVSDLHSYSRKLEQYTQHIIHESLKTFNKNKGDLPGHIAELIKEALEPPKAPYYQIIRNLIIAARLSKFKPSSMRINKKRAYAFFLGDNLRLPQILPFPGKKRDLTFFIVILIDTSGSMGTDDIKEALSGIKNIIESDRHCKVTVLEVDGAVQKEYNVLKVGDIDFKISGRGGTTLGPGLFRAKELECDVCLGFTDAMTEVINDYSRKALPKKLIWVVPKENDVKTLNKTGPIVRI